MSTRHVRPCRRNHPHNPNGPQGFHHGNASPWQRVRLEFLRLSAQVSRVPLCRGEEWPTFQQQVVRRVARPSLRERLRMSATGVDRMSRAATKLLVVACALSLHGAAFSQRAEAYTLTDWMRSWPPYRPATLTAPPPTLPAAAPVATAPPVITTPPVMSTPPAPYIPPATTTPPPVSAPPVVTAPPASVPAPSCAAPPPSYTAPPATSAPPVYAAPAPSCGVPAPVSSCDSRAPYYGPAAPTCGAAAPVAVVPVPPPPPPRRGCLGCFSSLFGLSPTPTVSYRTSWVRVPTTNYRPVTVYDPCSGAPTTQMQACTTFTWRAQRIPYTTNGAVFAQPQPSVAYYAPQAVNYAPAPMVYAAPQPAPPVPYTPPVGSPPTVQGSTPTTSGPAPYMPGGSSAAPADQRPSLVPDTAPIETGRQPLPQVPPDPDLSPPSSAPAGAASGATSTPRPNFRVVPVPDPESAPSTQQTPALPSIFNPNDRTASRELRQVAWAVAPIEWENVRPASRSVAAAPATRVSAPAAAISASSSSDGWHTVRD
jgi:hypothetical protein